MSETALGALIVRALVVMLAMSIACAVGCLVERLLTWWRK